MADRNPARLVAPLALLAAALAVIIVIQVSRSDPSTTTPAVTRPVVTQTARRSARPAKRAYVVKAGDTLSVIADRTGVSLDTIVRLNPDVDPNSLQTGQRLKLSP